MLQLYLDSYSYKKLSGTIVPVCKRCKCERIRKDGKYREFQQYKCRECGFSFSFTSDLPRRRFYSSIIDFAVNLYITTGISLRTIAKKILKFFKTRVSHEAIRKWIKSSKSKTNIKTGDIWHADETAIRIKGKIHWLWLVIDRETKTVISWRLSKDRAYKDAIAVMLDAKNKAGIPKRIITDGLFEYIKAIKKIFGWRNKVHSRTVGAAFGPNCIIERLNREIKRRVKWFGTFQSLNGANKFIQEWINCYNTEKFT